MIEFVISKESSLPLHIQLLDELRHKILSGELQPHDRLPGEWELVKRLDISRATIQRAWQSAQEEGLIYRVTGKGTFVAEATARETTERSAVGFVIPEYRGTFAMALLSGAERVLRREGYHVQFASTDRSIEEENRLIRDFIDDGIGGIILVPSRGSLQGRMLGELTSTIPIVLMDRPINGLVLPCISSNNYAGGLQAMEHLIELGHRRIIFVARPHMDLWSVAERYRAYADVMRRNQLTAEEPFFIGGDNEMSSYEAYLSEHDSDIAALVDRLKSSDRPTAIFAVNDWIAVKVQRAIKLAGLSNPTDISVVGFDDLDIARYQTPPLTTVHQNASLMGAEAARRLLTLIEGEENDDILTLIPTKLVVRDSTAPPAE